MDISIITSSKTKLEGYSLLKEFGMPFQNSEAFEKTNS
jgi:ribosomal protein L5